jgi:hypothetical protein
MLLTVIAVYYTNNREVSIKVVEDFWEGEAARPDKAYLQERKMRG